MIIQTEITTRLGVVTLKLTKLCFKEPMHQIDFIGFSLTFKPGEGMYYLTRTIKM